MPREHQLRSNLFPMAFLGSTGSLGKLANSGSLSSILTDVAADMPNLRDTRITRGTPVNHERRIARGTRVERDVPIGRKSPITRGVPTVPVVTASRSRRSLAALGRAVGRGRPTYDSSAIMSRVAAATASSQRSEPNWLRYGSRV